MPFPAERWNCLTQHFAHIRVSRFSLLKSLCSPGNKSQARMEALRPLDGLALTPAHTAGRGSWNAVRGVGGYCAQVHPILTSHLHSSLLGPGLQWLCFLLQGPTLHHPHPPEWLSHCAVIAVYVSPSPYPIRGPGDSSRVLFIHSV